MDIVKDLRAKPSRDNRELLDKAAYMIDTLADIAVSLVCPRHCGLADGRTCELFDDCNTGELFDDCKKCWEQALNTAYEERHNETP